MRLAYSLLSTSSVMAHVEGLYLRGLSLIFTARSL